MGSDHSAFEHPLYPQPVPICATEPRFCLQHYVQLRLRGKFFSVSGDDFKICDAADKSKIYFQCEGRSWSLREKRFLFDSTGVPVLNMKEKIMRYIKYTYENIFIKISIYQFHRYISGVCWR